MSALRVILILCGWILSAGLLKATHNRAGEITYRHLGGYRYEVTITTYTKLSSSVDRPSLELHWGDGTFENIPRVNGGGQGETVSGDIKMSRYQQVHTYPGPAIYEIFFEDKNRNGGVVNIPNSINVPFYVSTKLIINPFAGINNSVQLLNPPIDQACPGQIFIHNAGAYDPDGDSIAYRLTICRGEAGLPIAGFSQPTATESFYLNPVSGDLIWNTPPLSGVGEYNVAFIIEEWRNGILVGEVTRDMQIDVVPCSNRPPQIDPLSDYCVVAGDTVRFTVSASDPDNPPNLITISATSSTFLLEPPHQAVFAPLTGTGLVFQDYFWNPGCGQVRRNPYSVSFKVSDNGTPPLASFETVSIKVVSRGPDSLQINNANNSFNLSWTPGPCPQVAGYRIYRREGESGFNPSHCQTGIPASAGFELITELNNPNQLQYTDSSEIKPGTLYCYRIIAVFSDGAESYASEEICEFLPLSMPVLTNVSIRNTDNITGSAYVAWAMPREADTTIQYQYQLQRRSSNQDFENIAVLPTLNDTVYVDSLLDTRSQVLTYKVNLVLRDSAGGYNTVAKGNSSGSVFLVGSGVDNSVILSWNEKVDWKNEEYVVYRRLPGQPDFDSIGVTGVQAFRDSNLANGTEYCYRIRSRGAYEQDGFVNPIYNWSQELCVIPLDTEPPCPPVVMVNRSCDSLQNIIRWAVPYSDCNEDIISFRLHFSAQPGGEQHLIIEKGVSELQEYMHLPGKSVAGCYAVEAVDSAGNRSYSQEVCVDNCPYYELPNTFSPGTDGYNDLFRPFGIKFIESVEFRAYNRWGTEVFYTDDPQLLWDGRDKSTGKLLSDGTYLYVCVLNEIRLGGIVSRVLKGMIQIIGTDESQGN